MRYKVGMTDSKNRRKRSTKRRRPSNKGKANSINMLSFGKLKRMSTLSSKNTGKKRIRSATGRKRSIKSNQFKEKFKKGLYIAAGLGVFVGLIALISMGIFLKNLQESLPNPDKLVERTSKQSTKILDRDGKLLYNIYGEENREFVKIDDIPDHTKWAVLAAEDIDFYSHKGVDIPGLMRSAWRRLVGGEWQGGGSTVSQQMIKNTILTDLLGVEGAFEQSIMRKIKEILVTMRVEQEFTKEEILQLYMNEIALGGVNYGFQAASKSYFGKDVKDLTLSESAYLAAIIQSPSVYSPVGVDVEAGIERRDWVLDQMLKHNELTGVTEEEVEAAKEEEFEFKSAKIDIPAPHFVFYVRQLLEEQYGADVVANGGLKVTTTLDQSLQNIAEEEVENGVKTYGNKWGVANGAMVALDPRNNEVLAMVGSIDYNNTENPKIDGNVNVTISPRQMGSSVKPYTYLTAFSQGYGPWLLTPDIGTMKFGNYKPANWDDKYYGLMVAREALVKSRNIPAIYTTQLVGVDAFIATAEKLGITTLTDRNRFGLEITLGSGEMKLLEHAVGFSVFANEGVKKDSVAILKVEDSNGEVLFKQEQQKGTRVFDEKEIYMINWALCDLGGFKDQPFYNSYTMNGRRSFCGKTGTTNGPRDLIAMMYHKNLVVGVWAGNNNNVETPGAWSTTVPLPIASSFMQRVSGKYKPEFFTRPSGVNATSVCRETGATPGKNNNCKKVSSIYIKGRAPQVDNRETVKVCKSNGKVPTNMSAAEKYGLTKSKVLMKFSLENAAQQSAYEKYLKNIKNSNYIFSMPDSASCELPLGPGDAPVIEFTSPSGGTEYDGGDTVDITVDTRALESVTSVEYAFDGVVFATENTSPFSTSYTIPGATPSGTHTIQATVTDNLGKTGTATLLINVSDGSSVSVSMTAPANGQVVASLPVNLTANASSGVTKVDFVIEKVGGGYSKTYSDGTSVDGWSASWSDGSVTDGMYNITAQATSGGVTYNSSTIQVLVSL